MSSVEQAKLWWQQYTGEEETPLDGDTPGWAVSLGIHVLVLLGLGMIGIPEPGRPVRTVTVIEAPAVEDDVLMVNPEMSVSVDRTEAPGAESEQSFDVAQAVAPVLAEESVVPVEASEDLVSEIKVEPIDVVATGSEMNVDVAVKGDVGVGTTGASGAVDRLTLEIAASLEQGPTLVCWVFDQSVSLSGQRREIASRLDRVFQELGVNGSEKNRPSLTNLVLAYGKDVKELVPNPTREAADVVRAIEEIEIDDSGVEMTFKAVARAVEQAKRARAGSTRRVMIVVFTDEVGNDQKDADQVASLCRSQGMPVYVVGVPAPFGMRDVKMKFVEFDPKFDDAEQWAVVEQGPESLYPEVVRVHSGRFADEAIDSGFGPFSLSKLCAQTGGIYFCVHANRNTSGRVSDDATAPMASRLRYFFPHEMMRHYRPDYLSAAKVDQLLAGNRAMKALVEASRSAEISPMEEPTTVFPREDDGALALLLGEAQKKAARIQPKIDALHAVLNAGFPDRDKISSRRWQAGYDLSLGRVLAVKIRTDAYNIMLAQAKSGMKFQDPKNDTWELRPSAQMTAVGSQTEKLAKQATMLLERVVKDHPDTPWAMLAAEELKTPFGYEWKETFTGVMKKKMDAGGGGNAGPGKDDMKRNLAPPKPKRPLKNL